MVAEQLCVWLVEPCPGENAGPRLGPGRICDEVGPAFNGVQRAVQAAPVTLAWEPRATGVPN